MLSKPKRWLMVLATIALLWQSMGAALAAPMDCCPEQHDCCVVSSHKASCGSCVPAPAAAAGARLPSAAPAALERADLDPRADKSRVIHEIWRPPMDSAIAD